MIVKLNRIQLPRQVENHRLRKCQFYYYLEDDTIQISEPKESNSGLTQGSFVKRQRIPSQKYGKFYNLEDLVVGSDIKVFGRTFHFYDCDG